MKIFIFNSLRSLIYFAFVFVGGIFSPANAITPVGVGTGIVLPNPVLPQGPEVDWKKINSQSFCWDMYGVPTFKSKWISKLDTPRPLGKTTPDLPKRTQEHGILYHAAGMEYKDECVLEDRLNAIQNYVEKIVKTKPKSYLSVDDPRLVQFQNHAIDMVSVPNAFGDAIDRCFNSLVDKWRSCGGRFARTADRMEDIKRSLRVQVMPTYFYVSNSTGGATWAAGMADTDLRTMFAIVPHLHSKGYTRTFESLVCWEMGNNFGLNMGYWPRTLSGEIGSQSPCQIIK